MKKYLSGDKFRRFLQKIIIRRNIIQALERRNYPFFLIEILLKQDVDGVSFLQDRKKMDLIHKRLKEIEVDSVLRKDEEHGLFQLQVTYGVNGMSITCMIDKELITSPRYQKLYKIHKDLEDLRPPFQIISNSDSIKVENEAKLLEYLSQNGKKGIVIQRYKGLGEMTPTSCGRRPWIRKNAHWSRFRSMMLWKRTKCSRS